MNPLSNSTTDDHLVTEQDPRARAIAAQPRRLDLVSVLPTALILAPLCAAPAGAVLLFPVLGAVPALGMATAVLTLSLCGLLLIRRRARSHAVRRAVAAARAEERAALAREMHDLVSHQVTLIAMQAGALQVAQDANRTEIAGTIRELATGTLTELRALVGNLRAASTPQQNRDLQQIIELAERDGARVELDVDLASASVTGPVAAAAYRTVQEALTNATKHAPGAGVLVTISGEGGELAVTVTNTAPETAGSKTRLPSGGHGLRGLRERAAGIGGRCTAAPTAAGGFAVSAHYPLAG